MVPPQRIRSLNDLDVRPNGRFVMYWMIANRRTNSNFALQRAVEWSRELKKPLLIFEPLRVGYRWASDRFHQFVIQGMRDNAAACEAAEVSYFPYVEPEQNDGAGLLKSLADEACVVVSDDYPAFFLPKLLKLAARTIDVKFEVVDSNGILPMSAAPKVYARAVDFRRFLHKNLLPHFDQFPVAHPISRYEGGRATIPREITKRWPKANLENLLSDLSTLPIDHDVKPSPIEGGPVVAGKQLKQFLARRLPRYHEDRSHPDLDAASGLSPYLHFGHIAAHDVFTAVAKQEGWKPGDIDPKSVSSNTGWWGGSPALESFFDELITWREIGFNFCSQRKDYERYESLPDWARKTLEKHAKDPREFIYTLEEFEQAKTHDEVWNAAQRELVADGRIQNYLRMLWGKKILEWTAHPRDALAIMIELNNKYALDGRDPNSYSGIFWVLGRYDRAWGPERPIYGQIRYMSSENTVRKLDIKRYLARWRG